MCLLAGLVCVWGGFYLVQESRSHKAIWRSQVRPSLNTIEVAWTRECGHDAHRVGHPPIVVEITQSELEDYTRGSGHTPWKVIERARGYTRKTRGYVI